MEETQSKDLALYRTCSESTNQMDYEDQSGPGAPPTPQQHQAHVRTAHGAVQHQYQERMMSLQASLKEKRVELNRVRQMQDATARQVGRAAKTFSEPAQFARTIPYGGSRDLTAILM
ncbi:hypothetical protein FVE85_5099 [Porphyridium purpureum]|uniref:Uncharacterized protein n=1 Tax=Porphyridium purpureum TaxID=35688 RepID=A0A5J4Z3M5_PORPP|nr:hypothetical protein FVE85_5099 [Porphyridium purpureum]|eukprot:POR3044..scf295_1